MYSLSVSSFLPHRIELTYNLIIASKGPDRNYVLSPLVLSSREQMVDLLILADPLCYVLGEQRVLEV